MLSQPGDSRKTGENVMVDRWSWLDPDDILCLPRSAKSPGLMVVVWLCRQAGDLAAQLLGVRLGPP